MTVEEIAVASRLVDKEYIVKTIEGCKVLKEINRIFDWQKNEGSQD
jgi:hypothetical protein